MTYSVQFTRTAEGDAHEICRHIAADSPSNAVCWYERLVMTVESLGTCPGRCPPAPESRTFRASIRQLVFGNYRILFVIRKRKVFVLHVRHAARQPLRPK